MTEPLRWGILSTGNIAHQFAEGVGGAQRSTIAGVASRRIDTAQTFAQQYDIQTAHCCYDDLVADPAVDAIYVATPNALHHEWTLKSLRAGKHVLCEKPLAVNAAHAQEMFDVAAQAGRLLVEAFMYRSHPLTHAVLEQVRTGAIGEVRTIRTSFCYRTSKASAATNCRFSTELAGGALMDIGCYCIDFSHLIAGQYPDAIHGVAHLHASGVDDYAAATLGFPNGIVASFICGMTVQADNTAYICGQDGYLAIPILWKPPVKQAKLIIAHATPPRQDQPKTAKQPTSQTVHFDADRPLYALEADAFAAAVQDGASPAVTKQQTLDNTRVLDELRRQAGLPF